MDAFTALAATATSSFASTVGFPIASTTDYASTTMHVAFGIVGSFFVYDLPHVIAYAMIGMVLLVPASAFVFYKGY